MNENYIGAFYAPRRENIYFLLGLRIRLSDFSTVIGI